MIRPLFALLLLAASHAHAISDTPVQTKTCTASAANTLTCTFNVAATANNVLVFCATTEAGTITITTPPSGWTAGPSALNIGGNLGGQVFWKKAVGSETAVAVVWSNSASDSSGAFVEYPGSGLNLDALEASGEDEANAGTPTTAATTGTATNTTASALLAGCYHIDNVASQSSLSSYASGWTERAHAYGANVSSAVALSKIASSSASQNGTATDSVNQERYGNILVFGAAGNTAMRRRR